MTEAPTAATLDIREPLAAYLDREADALVETASFMGWRVEPRTVPGLHDAAAYVRQLPVDDQRLATVLRYASQEALEDGQYAPMGRYVPRSLRLFRRATRQATADVGTLITTLARAAERGYIEAGDRYLAPIRDLSYFDEDDMADWFRALTLEQRADVLVDVEMAQDKLEEVRGTLEEIAAKDPLVAAVADALAEPDRPAAADPGHAGPIQ